MQEVIYDSIIGLYSAPSLSTEGSIESESSGFESESRSETLKKD